MVVYFDMSNLARTKAFLRSFETRDGSNLHYYAPDVVQREFPNQLVKAGATRDLTAMAAGRDAGIKAVRDERYAIASIIEQGDEVAVEVTWTATLNVPLGALAAGDVMTAHLGMFLTWRDGKIVSQRNYDCFEPFEAPASAGARDAGATSISTNAAGEPSSQGS